MAIKGLGEIFASDPASDGPDRNDIYVAPMTKLQGPVPGVMAAGIEAPNHIGDPAAPGWWMDISNVQQPLPDPTTGGIPGTVSRLGWTKGIMPRTKMVAPLNGTMLAPPQGQSVNAQQANVGLVGLKNQMGRLQAAVAAQSTDFASDSQAVAKLFTTAAGWRGVTQSIDRASTAPLLQGDQS